MQSLTILFMRGLKLSAARKYKNKSKLDNRVAIVVVNFIL